MDDPVRRFVEAQERARQTEPLDATAAALATADAQGRPSARMVLVKLAGAEGFHIFTNYRSRKAGELAANPHAALVFHWPSRGEQGRFEGRVRKASAEVSDRYFAGRPRASQLGAWASRQSETLGSRDELDAAVRAEEAARTGSEVPRPDFWGGYVLEPERIEFWSDGSSRLHDREEYTRTPSGWVKRRLWP